MPELSSALWPAIAAALVVLATPSAGPRQTSDLPPEPAREFRAAWVATVANIDWPSRPGLTTDQMRSELATIFDTAARLRLNAIILQVRPACDALYQSDIEPWSPHLTGRMGQAPDPPFDPLAFAIEEGHRRGIEVHAWFNPYRALHSTAPGPVSANHISRTHPHLVRRYGRMLWLDPGEPAVRDHTVRVIMDVVRRYDIDGVHLDDYFYPYPTRDPQGRLLDFPDGPSWARYVRSGGKLQRDDWRRSNVDTLIERLYREIKAAKPWVKFGISPFGIWRPGTPPGIRGLDAFAAIYADSRRWIREGWLDYWTPQLYWRIDAPGQSYPVLLRWWVEQNVHGRHVWPGNFTSRVADGSPTAWESQEIVDQIEATRAQPGATGNVHFSMRPLLRDRGGIAAALARGPYREPALVPASPWLDDRPPATPALRVEGQRPEERVLRWDPRGDETARLWVVQTRVGGAWTTAILPQGERAAPAPAGLEAAAVSAVDRSGMRSKPALWRAAR
ncbi:MAG TPA: family 10 glycosylhydrolase [Chthonomonadales bacterium]|nr:family 10 glycosylhydrolase [Chthonomonadales bacterium]